MKDASTYKFEWRLISTFPGKKDNIYSDAGAKNTEDVEKFAKELK